MTDRRSALAFAVALGAIWPLAAQSVKSVEVAYSHAPVFVATAPVTLFHVVLTGDTTSSFWSPAPAIGVFTICQDKTGNRDFDPPKSEGFGPIGRAPGQCSTMPWAWDGTTLRATGPVSISPATTGMRADVALLILLAISILGALWLTLRRRGAR